MSQWVTEAMDTWRLTGELTFATVTPLLTEFTQQLAKNVPHCLDLQEVTRTDSAGLALLIEIRRLTKTHTLVFRNLPEQMLRIAAVSGVEELLAEVSTVAI
jgi:phospholipid transport system transporter-binding protein